MQPVEQLITDARAALNRGELAVAEKLFGFVIKNAPDAADAWNGLGAVRFEQGDLNGSLEAFEQAKKLALKKFAKPPEKLEWNAENKPLLRAMHGIGLNLFRAGRKDEARQAFEELLALNPDDNQGVGHLLEDLKKGKTPWKK